MKKTGVGKRAYLFIIMALVFAFFISDISPVSALVKAEAAEGISLTSVVLKPGKTKKISVEGLGTGFTWTSSNSSVAKITRKVKADNNATITAKSEGVAVITATNGKRTFQCSVVVMEKQETTAPADAGEKATTSKTYKNISVFEKSGTVSVTRSKKTISAVKDMKLKNDDYSVVGNNSFLRLCMDDDVYAYFESGTEFAVSKGWFGKIKVCMTKGEMILEVQKKLDSDNSFTVMTPNSSMSIRGTVVAIKTIPGNDGKTTTINYVLEGTAEVTYKDKKTKKDKVVTLKAGEGWETTTNKKGKVVSNKKADASKFDFENIDISKLKGADGADMIVTGRPDLEQNTDKDPDKDKNDNTGTDPDNDQPGDSTGTDSYEPAVPAKFDYDREAYSYGDSDEEMVGDNCMVEKTYDIFGVVRHKRQTIIYASEGNSNHSESCTDSYYDSNRVLRVTVTTFMEFFENFDATASGTVKEKVTTTETHYSVDGVKVYYNSVDETYDSTTWYDDQGREAEYMRMTVADNRIVEHIIYSYNKNGDKKESPAD